jgi:uncharacterized membrane protein
MKTKFEPFGSDRMRNNPDHYKWGIFYYNPDDSRVILPKRNQWMGWTLNFANLWTYVIILFFIGFVIMMSFLGK